MKRYISLTPMGLMGEHPVGPYVLYSDAQAELQRYREALRQIALSCSEDEQMLEVAQRALLDAPQAEAGSAGEKS